MKANPHYLSALQENCVKLAKELQVLEEDGLTLLNPDAIPTAIIHLVLCDRSLTADVRQDILIRLQNQCIQQGVGVAINRFAFVHSKSSMQPSIRICVSSLFTDKDLNRIVTGISAAMKITVKGLMKQ